jgi:dolichyl-phosphate-mannose-protein mannosyltransferase
MKRKTRLIILILVSFAVHFSFFGQPNETVFDEVHFGKFVSAYYTHSYYFDIHPPGGKLIIAGFGKLFNFHPEYSFGQIGETFPDHKYMALRFLPALAGALLPLVIFFLALELGFSDVGAFAAGMLTALDNALLTQSRFILLDPFLLLFGFSALLSYLRWKRNHHIRNLVSMAIFAGLAASIKWTGLSFLGLAGILELIDLFKNFSFKRIAQIAIYFVLVPFAIYFSVFAIHFALLTKTGDGDAFMTPAFQRTLTGSVYANDTAVQPLNVFQKFIELNKEMYTANATLTATHPYGSKWYTWPFLIRPIYYWNHPSVNTPAQEKVYLIGNPFIWWASTVAMLYLLLTSFNREFWKDRTNLIILAGFFLNLLPFIGISRVMFLYHYLSSYIFAILALSLLIDRTKKPERTALICIIVAFLIFLWFSPLSYGLPLEASGFTNRFWLTTWQ